MITLFVPAMFFAGVTIAMEICSGIYDDFPTAWWVDSDDASDGMSDFDDITYRD